MKRVFFLLALAALASLTAFGADVSGTWKSAKPAQTLTMKQADGKLTGTVQSAMGTLRIAEGKIEGDTVTLTFFVVLSNGKDPLGLAGYDAMAEEGQVTELTYKGTISGDGISVKVTQERLDAVRELSFHKAS